MMNIRAPSLLILLSIHVVIVTLVDILNLYVGVLFQVLKTTHHSGSFADVSLDLRLNVLALLLFGVQLLPLAAEPIEFLMIEIDLLCHLDDVLVWGQEVGIVITHDVSGLGIVPETPEERVNLLHISLKQSVFQEGKDSNSYLKEVTAPIREEVIPDAQDKAEGHRIQEE